MVPGFGVPMSDIQTDMRIENGYIYGTLKYCEDVTAVTGNPRELLDHGHNFILRYEQPDGTSFYGFQYSAVYDGVTYGAPISVITYHPQAHIPWDIVLHINPLPNYDGDPLYDTVPDGGITFNYRLAGDTENRSVTLRFNGSTITLEPQE